ncbi:MAG: deaminase [Candidatus Bathyarchaeota archaeon]|nr:deaminase [Candidatus Bathyarchaeota archaeon]
MERNGLVVGLTGSFGSGCTKLSESLHSLGFTVFSLSGVVKKEWENRNPGKKAEEDAKRFELQDIGDELRDTHVNDYLAQETIKETKEMNLLVFDSIRHTAEISTLRRKFNDFILIAVDAPIRDRWKRVRAKYRDLGLNEEDFEKDDSRDKNEAEISYGQQVELCVDEADILIDNQKEYNKSIIVRKLKEKIEPYVDLVSGKKLRHPISKESYMGIAYTASLKSKCYKRQVGAVIVDEKNDEILSVGHNQNPSPLKSCIEEYTKCNKEIYKENYFEKLKKANVKCPECKNPIKDISPTYKCECGCDLVKFFIPDRAVSQCTALHAEHRAFMGLMGKNVEGATMYVTTFPCAKCTNDIIHAKLARVVYVSAYPDPLAAKAFFEAEIPTVRFEGVKARAYFKLFGSWRREKEDEILRETS